MLGLGFVFFLGLYFFIIAKVVGATIKWIKKYTKFAPLVGGFLTLCLLSPVFWDLIPIYVMHKSQCSEYGGFKVNKSFEQWKEENPNMAETLVPINGKTTVEGVTTRYQLNQRFFWDITKSLVWHSLYKEEQIILDIKTGEILAKYTDFYTNLLNPMTASKTQLSDFKMWMKIDSCNIPGHKKQFSEFKSTVKNNKEISL